MTRKGQQEALFVEVDPALQTREGLPQMVPYDEDPSKDPELTEEGRQTGFRNLPEARASLNIGVVHQADRIGKDVTELL